jgi:signal transduction histidine kinase
MKKDQALTKLSIFIIFIGLSVLLGWVADIAILKSIVPGYVSMKINTTIGFIISGFLFYFLSTNRWNKACTLFSVILTVLATASLSQNIFDLDFGIDQLLLNDYQALKTGSHFPGRPSPSTSFCFALCGLSFLGIASKQRIYNKIAQCFLHVVTLISFIAIIGYLFNVPVFYKLSFFTSMAIHTSFTFFILSIGMSLVKLKFGIAGIFVGDKTGNIMSRNLFPKIGLAVIIIGFLRLITHRYQLISEEFGIALFVTFFMLVALYFIVSTSKQLNRIDDKRKEAEDSVIVANKNLEKTVKERTQHLEDQNQQLENFAYIISHNLRGPVSNLNSLLYFYKEEQTMEEKDFLMVKFEKAVNNVSETLTELLEVVSIRNDLKEEKEMLFFQETFDKTLESYQGQALEFKAKITTDFTAVPSIKYSSVYLESIMQNLLSNALKYRSPDRNPVIHFQTKISENRIEMTVADNGLGIDLVENGSRLFGFHKVFHKHPDSKGVGLYLTKAQVLAMGGEISATSEVDKGTTFKIVF